MISTEANQRQVFIFIIIIILAGERAESVTYSCQPASQRRRVAGRPVGQPKLKNTSGLVEIEPMIAIVECGPTIDSFASIDRLTA